MESLLVAVRMAIDHRNVTDGRSRPDRINAGGSRRVDTAAAAGLRPRPHRKLERRLGDFVAFIFELWVLPAQIRAAVYFSSA